MSNICEKHGVLKRSCSTCEMEEEIAQMKAALNEIRELAFNTSLPVAFTNKVVKIVEKALDE